MPWPCPCHACCSVSCSVCASCEGVGVRRGVHGRWLPAGCVSCPARMGCATLGQARLCRRMWQRQLVNFCTPAPRDDPPRDLQLHTGLCGAPQGLSTRAVWASLDPSCPPHSLFPTALWSLKMPRWSRGSLPLKVTPSQCRCRYPASLHKETEAACVPGAGLMLEVRMLLSTPWLHSAPQPAPGQGKDRGREHEGLFQPCAGVLRSLCQAVPSETTPRQWDHPAHCPPSLRPWGEAAFSPAGPVYWGPRVASPLRLIAAWQAGWRGGRGGSQAWGCILPW